ncbi:hypothetical protein J31TS4_39940 [Paenibacillus sp. J31TS4]|nr:YqzM family protein [Paenibacillus sp. J31TS4]GIP40714.1 hypothetical protein J31TS4_39940 [Paenibacillus sp. J31TS4]
MLDPKHPGHHPLEGEVDDFGDTVKGFVGMFGACFLIAIVAAVIAQII